MSSEEVGDSEAPPAPSGPADEEPKETGSSEAYPKESGGQEAKGVLESPQPATAAGGGEKGAGAVGATMNAQSLPIRQYLDQMIVPVLLPALNAVATERPPNPIEFLANFLLKNNPQNQ
mmetsp:Transcript_31282/g.77504  ORF Transcript_31282/g.77504 Transcript_31282/m.77504 type:complete len:119 (-) Transcript_31282:240-596(-)